MSPTAARTRALQHPQRPATTAGGINYRAIRTSADHPQPQTRRVQRTGGGSIGIGPLHGSQARGSAISQ